MKHVDDRAAVNYKVRAEAVLVVIPAQWKCASQPEILLEEFDSGSNAGAGLAPLSQLIQPWQ